MATTTSTKTTVESTDTAPAPPPTAEPGYWALPRPIVYEYRRGGGRKRYSRGAKSPQLFERDFSRSLERVADAVADGLGRYRSRRNSSARRKKDGAVKDFVRNVGRGMEKAMRTGAKAPSDLTRRMTMKRMRKLSRMAMVPAPSFFLVRR